MTFELQRFVRQTEAFNSGAQVVDAGIVNGPALYTYESATDTIAQIGTVGYFNSEWRGLCVGDFFICTGSDASNMFIVDAVDKDAQVVTLASFSASGAVGTANIQDGAVTTAKILNANVTLPKLAAGITPSHVVKYAARVTTVGGAAAEAFTITGALATDIQQVTLVNAGPNTVTLLSAVLANNTLTVTFSANPGAGAIVAYSILRAAA